MDEKLNSIEIKPQTLEYPGDLDDPLTPRPNDYMFANVLSAKLTTGDLKPLNLDDWKPKSCKVRRITKEDNLPKEQVEAVEEFEFSFSWSVSEVQNVELRAEVSKSSQEVEIEEGGDVSTSMNLTSNDSNTLEKQEEELEKFEFNQTDSVNETLKDVCRSSTENSEVSNVSVKPLQTGHQRTIATNSFYFLRNKGNKRKTPIRRIVTVKYELLSCALCDYTSYVRRNLARHRLRCHMDLSLSPYACDMCDFRTYEGCSLTKHVRGVHEGIRPYACDVCKYKSDSKGKIRLHIQRVHLGLRPHHCKLCDFKASSITSLKRHVRFVHEGSKPHACHMCDYRSSTTTYLRIHLKTVHDGVKAFVCDTCGYKAGYKQSLKQHIETVHEYNKYICDCGYKVGKKALFKLHIQTIHKGVESCHICFFKPKGNFDWKKHLRMHERATKRVKRLVCHICGRKVRGKENLKEHVRTVHRGIEYHTGKNGGFFV